MEDFDLRSINGHEFERLCKDLLEEELGIRLEIFAVGRDGGVDLRGTLNGDRIIVQCKHWMGTERATFIRKMEKNELSKVKRLKPDRYMVATTVSMTVDAKRKLSTKFAPFLAEEDIFGVEEIVARLRANSEIVKRHIKLWLNDMSILEAAVSRNVFIRSEHLKDELAETLRPYVPTNRLGETLEILAKKHFCLISGTPGSGKTTLAKVACAAYATRGFQIIEISDDVEDVFRVWEDGIPQLFFYDDFLGRSSLGDKLQKNEDERLLSLIRRVSKASNKVLICTTREYLLAQARQSFERLDRADLSDRTISVTVDAMSREERAAILYSHIYWAQWPGEVKRSFVHPAKYRAVIDHANFNPRILADLLGRPLDPAHGSAADQLTAGLSDPLKLWNHIFENQLSQSDRMLLLSLFSWGGSSEVQLLEKALRHGGTGNSIKFRQSLRVLSGTFIVTGRKAENDIEFVNPSVSDFLLQKVVDDSGLLMDILDHVTHFEQLVALWRIYSSRGGRTDRIPLDAVADRVEELALMKVGESSSSRFDFVARLTICLALANDFHLSRLAEYVAVRIARQGFLYRDAKYGDIATLIELTHDSWHDQVRQLHRSVLLEGASAMFNRDQSEAGVLVAAHNALQISEYLDPRIFNERQDAAARFLDELEQDLFFGGGELAYDLLEVIDDYIDKAIDIRARWPRIASELADFADAQWEAADPEDLFDEDFEYDDEEIDVFMSSLASYPTED